MRRHSSPCTLYTVSYEQQMFLIKRSFIIYTHNLNLICDSNNFEFISTDLARHNHMSDNIIITVNFI